MFGRKKLSHAEVLEHLERLPMLLNAFQRAQATAASLQTIAESHGANVTDVKHLGGKL